jgi:hypothetical protein
MMPPAYSCPKAMRLMAFSRNAVDLTVHDRSTIRGMYGKYVIVSGLYHAPPRGGDFNGYIDNILELIPLKKGNASK